MTPQPTIAIEDPEQPDVLAMLAEGDAHFARLYPAERNYLLDAATLKQPGVSFYVVRSAGRAVGCGALVVQGVDWAEIKRMYVDPSVQGRGIGRLILQTLEDHARRLGLSAIRLETGIKQARAIGLYRSAGYSDRGPFGPYPDDPSSVFLEKSLSGSTL